MDKMIPMGSIAVVGMGGIFPRAPDLSTFWQNIVDRIDASAEIAADRWIAPPEKMVNEGYQPDKAYNRRACLIREFRFDPTGLNLPPNLIPHLDPLYQFTLHAGREAVAELSLDGLDHNRIGVVLAAIALPTQGASALAKRIVGQSFETQLLSQLNRPHPGRPEPLTGHEFLSASVTSLPAALLADALGFGGKAFTLDAACASSLYAIKLACDELNDHRADAMLAGGVSRPDCLYTQVGFSQLRALSPSGHCAPFDQSADGLLVGEGAGILVLKRLEDAISTGDKILGVIRGIGLANDLHGNLLAPDSEGQLRAMKKAYEISGWSVRDVDYIECHGAGTPLGDATELNSLNTLWKNHTQQARRCAIGSIKSMIGHLLTAAASAGLIKVLLAFRHQMLPPSIHFQTPPTGSPLFERPFKVQTEAVPWHPRDEKIPRRAAINAFGFGGINAHLLIEEYIEKKSAIAPVSRSAVRQEPPITLEAGRFDNRYTGGPIAIVGMGATFGTLDSLERFETAVMNGQSIIGNRPAARWKGCDQLAADLLEGRSASGAWIDKIRIMPGDFRIPPAEIPDILPQHLLMLKTVTSAIRDAGMTGSQDRPGVGTIIGIDFDFEATNFHLRWDLFKQVNQWNQEYRLGLDAVALDVWRKQLAGAISPPLTHERTLGALGSMVASRLAREFRLGGPSFVISAGPVSGLQALELGIRSLQRHEVDAMVIGAVDLCADLRQVTLSAQRINFSHGDTISPLNPQSDGTLPGDGAGAVIVKRLDDALAQNDRIYAVIEGMGISNGKMKETFSMETAYAQAANKAMNEAGRRFSDLNFLELHASGDPFEDGIEKKALGTLFDSNADGHSEPCVLGATKPIIGFTGAATTMASLIKTALCLYKRQLPPWPASFEIDLDILGGGSSSLQSKQPLILISEKTSRKADNNRQPYRAGVAAIASDGGCGFAVLGDHPHTMDISPKLSAPRSALKDTRDDGIGMARGQITIPIGGLPAPPPLPDGVLPPFFEENDRETAAPNSDWAADSPEVSAIRQLVENTAATDKAHRRFLEFSADITRMFGDTLSFENDILLRHDGLNEATTPIENHHLLSSGASIQRETDHAEIVPVYSRDMCMEFAIGSVAKVFGPSFTEVDAYPARVRLPDEPLMLVDRILSIHGKKGGLGSGRIVTEHDVRENSWYLDGDRAPVCISVEAGQADLFLCAYLGIDLRVKGRRTYRLLDATVQFYRGLPRPGEVIRYDIRIEKFIRRGETYLFFFQFDGTINNKPLITMTDGCAGFFTPTEVENSGGIIESVDTSGSPLDKGRGQWEPLVPVDVETYADDALESLRQGNPAACFGESFQDIRIPKNLALPGDRMRLIHRIQHLDPAGGRCGKGLIRAEADIHPDDWFLTCHFVDDMVMPGTLMYECCAHTLRVLLQRMGWICDSSTACYEPVTDIKSKLTCRGPVIPTTRQVIYEVQIIEIGYHPEPHVIGEAHIFADGRHIVRFENISLKMTGVTLSDLKSFWSARIPGTKHVGTVDTRGALINRQVVFDHDRLLAFAQGNPSDAFGDPYRPFDTDRFIARLPAPPYLFIDKINRCDPEAWALKPDGWVEAEFNTSPNDWYFNADRSGSLPYAICLEIALQPCGWLAAHMGSALLSDQDLRFRNLGGRGTIKRDIPTGNHRLLTRVRLIQVSKAAGMIIETFEFDIRRGTDCVYQGDTYFGFFTEAALAQQEGLRETEHSLFHPDVNDSILAEPYRFIDEPPHTPDEKRSGHKQHPSHLQMPTKALRMIDRIDLFIPDGGPHGLGYLRAVKKIDPKEWFFKAHFYQDPVCPGSLGLESFIQLLKYYIINSWKKYVNRYSFSLNLPHEHEWTYRGQILTSNREVTVEMVITKIDNDPEPSITADGWLKVDGRLIYVMKQFGISLIPA